MGVILHFLPLSLRSETKRCGKLCTPSGFVLEVNAMGANFDEATLLKRGDVAKFIQFIACALLVCATARPRE